MLLISLNVLSPGLFMFMFILHITNEIAVYAVIYVEKMFCSYFKDNSQLALTDLTFQIFLKFHGIKMKCWER